MGKNIVLYASEIAIITGHNKYQKLGDFLIKLWQKYDLDDFNIVVDTLSKKNNSTFVQQTELEKIEVIQKKSGINITNELNNIVKKSKNADELVQNKNRLLQSVENKLDKNTKKELEKSVNNVVNTQFGIKNEDNVLQIYSKDNNITVYKISDFKKRKIGNKLYVGGKIDGLTESGEVVEIKNRMYKLFRFLRDYEKIQLQTYLYIFRTSKGYLVENYKNNIHIIEEDFDSIFMDMIILKLSNFELFFNDFMNNVDLKTLLLFGDEKLKQFTLENIFKQYNIM